MFPRIGVLTSGGDAPGMNAAVRAVVRAGIKAGGQVFAIQEGLQGLIEGKVHALNWHSVAGILQQGGTMLGTARSQDFRVPEGRRRAVQCLLTHGIDRLVVCGGDGSLTGASILVKEWTEHIQGLLEAGEIDAELAARHPRLYLVGLPGSIDNDLCGSSMTIGADTALHRIVAALDALFSTAASHQRTFVIEVMGRNCGFLALMAGLAIGAEGVLIPEAPPAADWADELSKRLSAGRQAGRRASMVIVAEGARAQDGSPISCEAVRVALEERLREDVRVTILGHVQRGGAPSAFDRNLSTLLGFLAGQLASQPDPGEPCLVGLVENRPQALPLLQVLRDNDALAAALKAGQYTMAQELRGPSFQHVHETWRTLVQARPEGRPATGRRLAILHAGGPAPGMNMAARAAVRLALDQGHTVVGVHNGFMGLVEGKVVELNWMSVTGWAPLGGAELGTHRLVPSKSDLYAIARTMEQHGIESLLMIGGWSGYEAAHVLHSERGNFPAFDIPILCVPASIDNNLPGSEVSVGADTALNCIVEAVDRIKRSAVSNSRCFIVEVMGHRCGYLALMTGLATGAEKVYLHETGISVRALMKDLECLSEGFRSGKKVGLAIRNEHANELYSTSFVTDLFEEEGGDLFDVRQAILGHLQQGGNPSPFDRSRAVRLAWAAIEHINKELCSQESRSGYLGYQHGKLCFTELHEFPRQVELENRRPRKQWWLKSGTGRTVSAALSLERALTSLRGLAVGDGFGERFFGDPGISFHRIVSRQLPEPPWNWTDDTAMALSIFRVLRDFGEIDQDLLAEGFASEYRREPGRGYGRGAHTVLSEISAGRSWRRAAPELFGHSGSCGNGAAMRAAPLGAFFAGDWDRVVSQAVLSAEITHSHAEGIAGAVAVAVAAASDDEMGLDMLERARDLTPAGKVRQAVERALLLPLTSSVGEAAKLLGSGSDVLAEDTVPFTLWCAARHWDNYGEALWNTVAGLGDRDTTCAIVGGILASRRGLPEEWWANCEDLPL